MAAAVASSTTSSAVKPLRSRLSISSTNALANFQSLQEDFKNHRLVIFLDYDGTLTPIVSDPASAVLAPTVKETLERLRQKFTTGVITGRSLDKIQKFVGIPQLYYAGSHGFDITGPNDTEIKNQVAKEFLVDLEQIRDTMAEQVAGIDGADVEDNVYSISLHYRNVAPEFHEKIHEVAKSAAAAHPNIRFNEGKMVHEFKPKIDWNKGKALMWLLEALGLDKDDNVYTIYIGDDTTDEDAFEVFRMQNPHKGAGILVTEHSKSTGASFTLHDTKEVCEFLNKLIAQAS